MSTMPAKIKSLLDNQIRTVSGAAATYNGTAQAKGTATDLRLDVIVGADGATAVGGVIPIIVQGSNSTVSSTFTTTVSADKGALGSPSAATTLVAHYQNLQFAFYRLNVVLTAGATANVSAAWQFMPMEDSFDANVQ